MSYIGYDDFLLINNELKKEIDIDNLSILFSKDDILAELNYNENFIRYIDNLLSKNSLDITINNQLKDKIIKYTDNFNTEKKINNQFIDIELSYYATENMKKYMFVYDFISEYYRNLAEIIKSKYSIDNKSLYSYEFEIKVRYIIKKDINNNDYIINIYNYDKTNYYIVKFKLESDTDIVNIDELSQPNGKITNLNVDEKWYESFKSLFDMLIMKKNLFINLDKIDYYSLLSKSYLFKSQKILLNYYIAKSIYFYFLLKYKTKVEEINNIILIDFPAVFNNFNNIINEENNDSFIKVIKNTKQKQFKYDKQVKKDIDHKAKQIALLLIKKKETIENLKKNKNNYNVEELKIETDKIDVNFDSNIDQLNIERKELLDKRYINREDARVDEAKEYKINLNEINTVVEQNKDKIDKINKVINNDRKYLNIISIIIYISSFLLIILFVTLSLSSVIGISNINISLPITYIILSIILYIIIYNIIDNNKNIYTKTYKKSNILNKIYNSLGLELFETFVDGNQFYGMTQDRIDNLDPIVRDIVTSLTTGENINDDNLNADIEEKIEKDISRKMLITLPGELPNKFAIDMDKRTIIDINSNNMKHDLTAMTANGISKNYSNISLLGWNNYNEPRNNGIPEISFPIIKHLHGNMNSIALVNNNEEHTIYTLKVPKGIAQFDVTVLVVGGGSFGGNIAPKEAFENNNDIQSVQNMGEGGAGGAVIVQKISLIEGEYEIGVGRGGSWLGGDYLANAIENGQATSSYIKNKQTNKYIVLAQGAEYIDYGGKTEYNMQLSGGNKEHENSGIIYDSSKNTVDIKKNISFSANDIVNNNTKGSGGRGGLVLPDSQQVGYNLITQFGDNKDTFYLSGAAYESTSLPTFTTTGDIGVNIGVNINNIPDYNFHSYINDGHIAGGGGAASFCIGNLINTDTSKKFFKLGDLYYTCISNDTESYGKGMGGGGDGSGIDYGKHALQNTGGGGGGGKFRGGDGGSGLVLIKYNHATVTLKLNDLISLESLRLKNIIYDIKVLNTNFVLKTERLKILELSNAINDGNQEIRKKYEDLGVKIDLISIADAHKVSMEELISEAEIDKNELIRKIEQYEIEINKYNDDIYIKSAQTELSESELRKIKTNIILQQEQLIALNTTITNQENIRNNRELVLDEERLKYIQKIAIKLEAEACIKLFLLAEAEKRRDLVDGQILEAALRKEATDKADEDVRLAQQSAATAEFNRDEALNDQKIIEDSYNKNKDIYLKLLASTELTEKEKGYFLSLKLAIDYRIAGISIKDDENSKLYENMNDDDKRELKRSLNKDKQNREKFVNDIITELTLSLSEINNGVMSSRFSINRISSGNLKLRENVESDEERAEREKNEFLKNYESSAFINEETFANFNVTEHFIENEDQGTNVFRKSSESYIPPDNITVIDIEIFAHPQLLNPRALDILTEIIKQIKDLDSNIRNSRYLRYTRSYKTSYNENPTTIISHTDKKWIEVEKESSLLSNSSILINNIDLIDSIFDNFNTIDKLNIDTETYYDNVNPLVKKEYKKYSNNENNSKIYLKMVENSNNLKLYDIRLKETILNYIITLCLLISIYVLLSKFYNNIFILIIFTIIILIFTLIFLISIYEIVNTKSDKNYWSSKL